MPYDSDLYDGDLYGLDSQDPYGLDPDGLDRIGPGDSGQTGARRSRAASPQATRAHGSASESGGRAVRGGRTVRGGDQHAGPVLPFLPAGWPAEVLPPGVEDWERSASAFLFDCCPADFRGYQVLRRHPVVLAQFAAQFVASQVQASEEGLSQARVGLRDLVEPQVVEEAVDTWQRELVRLQGVREAIALVDDALRGMAFVPRL